MFTELETITATIKDESNVLTPSILLARTGHNGSNYIRMYDRYYWVKYIIIVRAGLIQLDLVIDVLGTYRGHINNTQAFVVYDSTANTEIPDRRLAVKTTATVQRNSVLMPWEFVLGTGTNFIAVAGNGKNADSAGSTGVYIISNAGISDLGFQIEDLLEEVEDQASAYSQGYDQAMQDAQNEFAGIMTDPTRSVEHAIVGVGHFIGALAFGLKAFFIDGLKNVWKSFVKLITGGDALKNIRSAYWLPFVVPTTGMTSFSKLALGGFVETITGGLLKVSDPIIATHVDVDIPWQFSDWRNVSCTEIQLYIPLIGLVSIPASAVKGFSTIHLYFGLNLYSGSFSVRIVAGAELGTFGADCRMPIMVGDSNVNVAAIANTIAAGAAAVASGGSSVATASLIGSTVASGLESIVPINTTVGGIGGGAGNSLTSMIHCITICHGTSQEPSALLPVIGTPTNQLKTLSTISGYCQTMQAHMNMTAVTGEGFPTEGEVEEVDRLLDAGIYLE